MTDANFTRGFADAAFWPPFAIASPGTEFLRKLRRNSILLLR